LLSWNEQWRWDSLYRRVFGAPEERALLSMPPLRWVGYGVTKSIRLKRMRSEKRSADASRDASRTAVIPGAPQSDADLDWNTAIDRVAVQENPIRQPLVARFPNNDSRPRFSSPEKSGRTFG
jgi:hypothetical protein